MLVLALAGVILWVTEHFWTLSREIATELRDATTVQVSLLRRDPHRVGIWPELWRRPGEELPYRVVRTAEPSKELRALLLDALSTISNEPSAWPVEPGYHIVPEDSLALDVAFRFNRRSGSPFWLHLRLPWLSTTVYVDGATVQSFTSRP